MRTTSCALLFLAAALLSLAQSFTILPHRHHLHQLQSSSTRLFVFDFFKQRSQEGVEQIKNIAIKGTRGQLGAALLDAAAYTANTNSKFADGLAKSRVRFLKTLESLLTGVNTEEILKELEDLLLQADLGAATAEDIVVEVKSLKEDADTLLKRDDLLSIIRGKLLEALDVGNNAVTFSDEETGPTVLFIMGAVRLSRICVVVNA
jgi:signal recognition particle GTPase